MSPWHCSVAVTTSGSFITAHKWLHRQKFELIHRGNQPYFFREKSPLYEWEAEDVEFEHQYGQHLVVRRRGGEGQKGDNNNNRENEGIEKSDKADGLAMSERNMDKLAVLAILHKSVKLSSN